MARFAVCLSSIDWTADPEAAVAAAYMAPETTSHATLKRAVVTFEEFRARAIKDGRPHNVRILKRDSLGYWRLLNELDAFYACTLGEEMAAD